MVGTVWDAFLGWTGINQYDEGHPVDQQFLYEFERLHGRRPEWCVVLVNRDVAVTILQAIRDAHALSFRGVKETLERVKSFPAASGAPAHAYRAATGLAETGWDPDTS